MRRTLAAAALVLVAGTACDRDQTPTVDLPALRIKLQALTTDACHSDPRSLPPKGCQKYVTQLGNTARTVAAAAQAGNEGLAGPAEAMSRGVKAYRAGKCELVRPVSDHVCYEALDAIAAAVEQTQRQLGSQP